MIKKLFVYLVLTLFTTAVSAEELIMRCGKNTYKYLKTGSADNVLYKNAKFTKNKYKQWCPDIIPKTDKYGVSIEGVVKIIKNNKATCLVKKYKYKYQGKVLERTNSVSVNDFTNLTRHTEWYHTNTGSKKNVKDFKCKKKKK